MEATGPQLTHSIIGTRNEDSGSGNAPSMADDQVEFSSSGLTSDLMGATELQLSDSVQGNSGFSGTTLMLPSEPPQMQTASTANAGLLANPSGDHSFAGANREGNSAGNSSSSWLISDAKTDGNLAQCSGQSEGSVMNKNYGTESVESTDNNYSLTELEQRVEKACASVERLLREREERFQEFGREIERKEHEIRAERAWKKREREARELQEASGWPQQQEPITGQSQWLCEHYQRHCRVRFPCCPHFYSCHRCHNNSKACDNEEAKASHATHLKCSYCQHEQEIGKDSAKCCSCGAKMSAYFCAICKYFTSFNKNPHHCEKCGICRIYKDKSFHCEVCNVCVDKRLQGKHKCRPDCGHEELCITLKDDFSGQQILPYLENVFGLSNERECSGAKPKGRPSVPGQPSLVEHVPQEITRLETQTKPSQDRGEPYFIGSQVASRTEHGTILPTPREGYERGGPMDDQLDCKTGLAPVPVSSRAGDNNSVNTSAYQHCTRQGDSPFGIELRVPEQSTMGCVLQGMASPVVCGINIEFLIRHSEDRALPPNFMIPVYEQNEVPLSSTVVDLGSLSIASRVEVLTVDSVWADAAPSSGSSPSANSVESTISSQVGAIGGNVEDANSLQQVQQVQEEDQEEQDVRQNDAREQEEADRWLQHVCFAADLPIPPGFALESLDSVHNSNCTLVQSVDTATARLQERAARRWCSCGRNNEDTGPLCELCYKQRYCGPKSCPYMDHHVCHYCLEDASSGCLILPCSHKIHRECVIALIQGNMLTCPACGQAFLRMCCAF